MRRFAALPLLSSGLLALAALLVSHPVAAQPSPAELLAPFRWRNVGPSNMMGRISSIDALAGDHRVVLIGSASGGVWLSRNAGTTFTPIFDDYGSQSIGDVAFFQRDPDVIWVGTGEATNRNSVGWGDGVYRSTDGGKSFTRAGLEDTYQIAAIATHPTDPDVAYVAALGQLWGSRGRRGLFKTTDGGRTWRKLTNGLPDDARTGASAIALDPRNPDVLYVGMYERIRRPWIMDSGGPNGGVYKSADGGRSWRKLRGGLPTGPTGMVDVDVHRADPRIVVAYVEADERLPPDLAVPGSGIYRSEDGGETWRYQLRHTSRPYYHGRIRIDPVDPLRVQVVSRDATWTDDGGRTWKGGRYYSTGGGDDHDAWICPEHPDVVYSATDQGAHLQLGPGGHVSFTNMPVGQYYAIGVDMRDPYWVYGGLQDNGGWVIPSNSRNRNGIREDDAIEINGGDGFHMEADPTDWRTVYTTAHVGYFGKVDVLTREREFITPTPATTVNFDDYYDPRFAERQTDYTINPEEAWLWRDLPNRTVNGSILPPQFRWNWSSPLVLSPTHPHALYVGSNHLFKSIDRGRSWLIVSPDLTRNDPATRNSTFSGGLVRDVTGAENWNTIFSISESPLDPSVVWVGTDDGHVQVTTDGGRTWANVTASIPGIPDRAWVSRVEASRHDRGSAYVTVDNHRLGDNAPYVWRTTDLGRTWTDLAGALRSDLAAEPSLDSRGLTIHTIVEDAENPDLLFLGTEFGVHASLDGGRAWTRVPGIPPVAAHDLVIHPRDGDLVVGTHGRSIWILDDIGPLQQLVPEVVAKDLHVFDGRVATRWLDLTNFANRTDLEFNGPNPPRGALVHFYLRQPSSDSVTVTLEDPRGGRTRAWRLEGRPGIHRVVWDFTFLPDDAELAAYREALRRVHAETVSAVEGSTDTRALEVMRLDLLATERSPNLVAGSEYRDRDDARRLLLDHLRAIARALEDTPSLRGLNGVRQQLLSFSPLLGDRVFFDFYPGELRPPVAGAGTYHVRVSVDGREQEGRVTVREDPLLVELGPTGR